MCDLFAMTSRYAYRVDQAIEAFAALGRSNRDGWGIGYYRNLSAIIKKSREPVYSEGQIHPGLCDALGQVKGKIVLGHIRYTSSGATDECHSHPFSLNFLDRDWIFAHNGTCRDIESYATSGTRLEGVGSDSARIFEYLRDRIMDDLGGEPDTQSGLLSRVAGAVHGLLRDYEGGFNFLLTDGQLMFAFSHYRPLWILHRSKLQGDAMLITTIDEGLTDAECWISRGGAGRHGGTLLVFSEDLIIATAEISNAAKDGAGFVWG